MDILYQGWTVVPTESYRNKTLNFGRLNQQLAALDRWSEKVDCFRAFGFDRRLIFFGIMTFYCVHLLLVEICERPTQTIQKEKWVELRYLAAFPPSHNVWPPLLRLLRKNNFNLLLFTTIKLE